MKRITALLLCLVITASLFVGCGSQAGTGSQKNAGSDETPQKEQVVINPFTGESGYNSELLTTRPVAVMVNNIEQAIPQRGISKADIIYEMPVEGAITRLMAVFSDYKNMPEIGSIRSARHDFIEMLMPLNALYLHFGRSEKAAEVLASEKINDIDGLAYSDLCFTFDKVRNKTKAREHCWFSSGEQFTKGVEKKGYNTSMEKLTNVFNFVDYDKEVTPSADAQQATNVTVKVSSLVTSTFDYDAATKKYKKGQYGNNHIDETTGKAVEVTNIFIMYTQIGLLDNQVNKEIKLESGKGYYISHGVAVPVTFEKKSASSKMTVYDKDGKEVSVNPGNSWFTVAYEENYNKITFTK